MEYMESKMQDQLEASMSEYDQYMELIKAHDELKSEIKILIAWHDHGANRIGPRHTRLWKKEVEDSIKRLKKLVGFEVCQKCGDQLTGHEDDSGTHCRFCVTCA